VTDRPRLVIVKTGAAVPEARGDGRDFEHWFADGLGPGAFEYRTVRVDAGESLPEPAAVQDRTAVLVTGSPAMVSDRADWSERTAEWLAEVHRRGAPMLGVCYGHQLLAHALGGRVGPNPAGRRMGRVEAAVTERTDPLLGPFAPAAAFNVSHVEAVLEPPVGARVVATAAHDPHHALRFGERAWGVQFHPEFDAGIMADYLRARTDVLRAEGQDPEALRAELRTDSAGRDLLGRFAALAAAAEAAA
jgi:GMP synthase (glutamine-hydrolysing)